MEDKKFLYNFIMNGGKILINLFFLYILFITGLLSLVSTLIASDKLNTNDYLFFLNI